MILYRIYFIIFAESSTDMKLRLREILKRRSMTLRAFSELSGISQPNLSNYLNGNVSPTLETLTRIAEALGIPITELFEEPDSIELYVRYNGNMYNITSKDIIKIIETKDKE